MATEDRRVTDLYALLEIDNSASDTEIRAAHRRLIKAHHPDAGGDGATAAELNYARDTLLDPERRRAYDQLLAAARRPDAQDAFARAVAKAKANRNAKSSAPRSGATSATARVRARAKAARARRAARVEAVRERAAAAKARAKEARVEQRAKRLGRDLRDVAATPILTRLFEDEIEDAMERGDWLSVLLVGAATIAGDIKINRQLAEQPDTRAALSALAEWLARRDESADE